MCKSRLVLNEFISQKVFVKLFCKCQFLHKSVNVSLITTNIKNKLQDLCGNGHLPNDFINTLCELRVSRSRSAHLFTTSVSTLHQSTSKCF